MDMMLYLILRKRNQQQVAKKAIDTVEEVLLEETNENIAAEEIMEDVIAVEEDVEEESAIALYLCEEDEEEYIEEEHVVEEERIEEFEEITFIIDGNYKWKNSTLVGDYREFRCAGFEVQPEFLTDECLYNNELYMDFNNINVKVLDDSDFTINSKSEPNGECVFVSNGIFYIHIASDKVSTGGGTTYAKSFKKYLTENPITLSIRKRK